MANNLTQPSTQATLWHLTISRRPCKVTPNLSCAIAIIIGPPCQLIRAQTQTGHLGKVSAAVTKSTEIHCETAGLVPGPLHHATTF